MNEDQSFFSEKLLQRLETDPAIAVAYESQVRSAEVGFDFATATLAFDRLEEEVDELTQALSDYRNGSDTAEHLCDEATDIIFGVVNVLRHKDADMQKFFQEVEIAGKSDSDTSLEDQLVSVTTAFESFKLAFSGADDSNSNNLLGTGIILVHESVFFVKMCDLDPNEIMKKNVTKYLSRCKYIEGQLHDEGKVWQDISLDEIYGLWKQAKKAGF